MKFYIIKDIQEEQQKDEEIEIEKEEIEIEKEEIEIEKEEEEFSFDITHDITIDEEKY